MHARRLRQQTHPGGRLRAPGFTTTPHRKVSDKVKQDVEHECGMPVKKYGKTLESDHIVSLELGGSNNPERRTR